VREANRFSYRVVWGSKVLSGEPPNSLNNTAVTIAELLNTDSNNVLSEKHPSMTEVIRELPLRTKQAV